VFLSFFRIGFTAPAVCPELPTEIIDIDAVLEEVTAIAKSRADQCIALRNEQAESTATDFYCPSGDMSASKRPYTDPVLAYQIAVGTLFETIDDNAFQYLKALYCIRETDIVAWQQSNKIITDTNVGFASKYLYACDMDLVMNRMLNLDEQDRRIWTSDTFPQWADCYALAQKKTQALYNLATLVASYSVGKSYQNDKDTFVDDIK